MVSHSPLTESRSTASLFLEGAAQHHHPRVQAQRPPHRARGTFGAYTGLTPPGLSPLQFFHKPTLVPKFSGHFRKDVASPSLDVSPPTLTPFLPALKVTFSRVNVK